MQIIKESISQILSKTQKAIEERNYSFLIDLTIPLISIATIIFVIIYKFLINFEKSFWGTSNFVLSDPTKDSLPQLLFFSLLLIGFLKWVLTMKKSQNYTYEDEKLPKEFKVNIFKIGIKIGKKNLIIVLLILIISIFTLIKIPAWDTSFTYNHPLKYNTYVGPAQNMLENNDPFHIQRKYMNNPLRDSRGMGEQFGSLPILEWILFIAYKVFDGILSFEITTRLTMNLIGIFTLLSFYKLVNKMFESKVALISTFLFALNPIFNLSSFVTVYDTINLGLAFLAMSVLIKGLENKSTRFIFLSALLLGIGASIKENIFIWTLPVIFTIIYFNNKHNLKETISKFCSYVFFAALPYIVTLTTINYFPQKNPLHFILFIVFTILITFLYLAAGSITRKIEKSVIMILIFIKKYRISLLLIPVLAVLFIKAIYLTELSEEFLTDGRLLFNIDLYVRLLEEQLIPYSTIFIFTTAFISLFWFLLYENSRKSILLISSFTVGSLIYLVVASKVLFFHSYYWTPILSVFILMGGWGIHFLSNLFRQKYVRFLFLSMILVALLVSMTGITRSKLNRENRDVYDVIEYINSQDFPEGTTFIDQGDLTYLTLKTNLYRLYDPIIFGSEEFKESVEERGFVGSLEKFKINYLMTGPSENPDYRIFANAFSKDELASASYRRTDQIYQELYPTKYKYFDDNKIRQELLEENMIEKQFRLVKNYPNYKIYEVLPICIKTIIK